MMEIKQPGQSKGPTQYHCYDSCNRCSRENQLIDPAYDERGIYETKTKCKFCGFEDYWSYGFYESGSEMVSKCNTYSFDEQ